MDMSRRSTWAGVILVVLGLVLLAMQFVEGLGDSLVLFIIGGAFLIFYFQRRSYGLLIPAGILLGIGLGSVGERALAGLGGLDNIGLGIGFLSIYFIDRIYRGDTPWWPLIPGGLLVISGLASSSRPLQRILEVGWPLLLIAFGLALLMGLGAKRRAS